MSNPQAIIYCRVSSRAQEAEGHGLQSQETRCREFASSKGYEVAAVFPDTFTGGGDFMKRPGMVALLSFLDAQPDQKFIVIFDDLKRFARDTRFHLDLREAFRNRGATIECLNFKFEDTPEGEFIETIMAAQGALERKQNGRQVSQKMAARMRNGYWVHNAPIGYRYKTVKGHGKLLIRDEPLASIIVEAFEGYASGRFQSQAEVKRFFESFPDFPRAKNGDIRQQRVTDILTHPAYTGHICSETYGINWLKAQHEPLITLALFNKVQERRQGVAKAPKRPDIGETFVMRGMVTCACCGASLLSSITRGNGGHYPYYLCQTKGCEAYGKSIPRDKLEGDVSDLIKTLQPTDTLMMLATTMFHDAWNARRDQAQDILGAAKRRIATIDKEIATLLDRIMAASNHIVIQSYESKIGELEQQKALMAETLHSQPQKPDSFEDKLEPVLTFLANPWKLWETGHIHARRLVAKLAFADRVAYDRKLGARTPEIALPFKALGDVYTLQKKSGAVEKTRTSTGVTPQRPQRCASTNSATTAQS